MRTGIYSCIFAKDDPQIAEEQIDKMKAAINQVGWKVEHVYRDVVFIPGTVRVSYQKMLSDAKRHNLDVIFFWALEQFSRQNANNTILLLHKISQWNVGFCSYTEKHFDSCHASKDTMLLILETLIKQNKIYIGEQTRVGIERQRRNLTPGPKGQIGPGRPSVIFDQKRALDLRLKGKSYEVIATTCGVSKATVCRFFKEQNRKS